MDQADQKVGIVPYRWYLSADGEKELQFLVHRPKPKRDPNNVPEWGLARGTVESNEPTEATAIREVEEELGLRPEDMHRSTLTFCGRHRYDSPNKPSYDIPWFKVEAPASPPVEILLEQSQDSVAIAWKSEADIHAMAKAGEFKEGYLPILGKIAETIEP